MGNITLMSYSTPILFLIFNRPESTKIVFDRIRSIKPLYLYIAADGPRLEKEGEAIICENTRRVVMDNIDWSCEVKTLFRDINLGCGRSVSSAINWFFENVEEGIILEDDCLPSQTFFKYAEFCLNKYRHNPKIMHIGGCNLLGQACGKETYYYSSYSHVWGWATWRRAWSNYQFNLNFYDINEIKTNLKRLFPKFVVNEWLKIYQLMINNEIDTWDYQWSFSIWIKNGLAITPNTNFISNIGFGPEATHTFDQNHRLSRLYNYELEKISPPNRVLRNKYADLKVSENVYGFANRKRTSDIIGNTVAKMKNLKRVLKRILLGKQNGV